MRLKALLMVIACLVLAAFTMPVVPCSLPKDVWPEEEFARVKAEIKRVDAHLTQLYLDSTKNPAAPPPVRYNLVAKYGALAEYRPLLSSHRTGWHREATWHFGVPALPNMPHVHVDPKKQSLQVTPDTLEAFLAWARTAKLDAATGMYVTAK